MPLYAEPISRPPSLVERGSEDEDAALDEEEEEEGGREEEDVSFFLKKDEIAFLDPVGGAVEDMTKKTNFPPLNKALAAEFPLAHKFSHPFNYYRLQCVSLKIFFGGKRKKIGVY